MGHLKKLEKQVEEQSLVEKSKNKELETAKTEVKTIRQQMDNLVKDKTDLEKKVADYTKEQDKLVEEYKKKIDELEKKRDESEKKVKDITKDHEKETDGLKKQIEKLSANVKTAQESGSEVESLTKVLVETKQEAVTFKKQVEAKDQMLQNVKAELDDLKKQANDSSNVKHLEEEMQKLQKDSERHREKLLNIKRELMMQRNLSKILKKKL